LPIPDAIEAYRMPILHWACYLGLYNIYTISVFLFKYSAVFPFRLFWDVYNIMFAIILMGSATFFSCFLSEQMNWYFICIVLHGQIYAQNLAAWHSVDPKTMSSVSKESVASKF